MRSNTSVVFLAHVTGDDFVILLLHGGLTWCIIQSGLALLNHVLLLRKIHLEFFVTFFLQEEHSSNAGPTRADQCSDGWHCQVLVGFCLGSMVTWQT